MLSGYLGDTVGSTPLIKIKSLSKLTGCEIYGKAEFLNPGGSVKDRAALGMIRGFEQRGELKPGGTIVEGTAGNTGIGLATLAAERGYRVKIVAPNNQTEEKYTLLRALGCELTLVPPVPFRDENHFYHQAKRLAEATPGAVWANQFENPDNGNFHFETTGPEIWTQSLEKVDIFCMSVGTGGTISGVSRYLKSKNRNIEVYAVDPDGSGIASYLERKEFVANGSSITEGIGIMRLTENFKSARVDFPLRVSDQDMIDMCHHLARNDGLVLGSSAALNLAAALKIGFKHKNSNKVIVTILCDHGSRYFTKLFNQDFLKEKNLLPHAISGNV
ncbi:MAG: cysteine synthase A [Pseudomonadota bacterium]